MTTNQLISQPIEKIAHAKPQAKSWFGRLLDSRRQAKEAKAAINAILADSPDAYKQFASLYPALEIKVREKMFASLVETFSFYLRHLSIEPEIAGALERNASCLEMVCSDERTIRDSNSSKPFADNAGKLLCTLNSVLEDQTECRIFHQHEGLILASARLKWAMTRDSGFLKDSLRDPLLQQWAFGIIKSQVCNDLLAECANFKNLVPELVRTGPGRDALYSALSKSENGVRNEMILNISACEVSSLSILLDEWVKDAEKSQFVLPIALKSRISDELLLCIARAVYGSGRYELLEEALNLEKKTRLLVFVLQSEKGSSMIKNAMQESDDDKKELLAKLAGLGEKKIYGLLSEWANSPDMRINFFTVAALLDETSNELQAMLGSSLSYNMHSSSKSKAARKAYRSVMAKEMQRKALAVKEALEAFFRKISGPVQDERDFSSGKAEVAVQTASIKAVAELNVDYSKDERVTSDPDTEATLKTAALHKGLNEIFESVLGSLLIRPGTGQSKGECEVKAGHIILNAGMKVEFCKS